MTRRWATAIAACVLGTWGTAKAEEPGWKPASGPAPAPAPVAAPVFVPTPAPVANPAPASSPVENSNWLPAKIYPVETPLKPVAPESFPPLNPVSSPVSDPGDPNSGTPRDLTPPGFPPLLPIPTAKPNEPATLPDLPKSPAPMVNDGATQKLPAPKPADTESLVSPSIPTSTLPPTVAAPCPDPALQPSGVTLLGAPAASSRRRVFGSPGLNLSRDYYFRDIFGTDIQHRTPEMGADGLMAPIGDAGQSAWYLQADYLLWWTSGQRIPVLATTSASGTGFGFLGNPDTRNLLGPGDFGPTGARSGFRIRAGRALDECGLLALDGSFFFLGTGRRSEAFDSAQYPVITRPFFAPNTATINTANGPINLPGEFGELVAYPGLSSGRLVIDTETQLWGFDLNLKRSICRSCDGSKEWFFGYRNVNLEERLTMTEFITATSTNSGDPVGTTVVVGDSFRTRNQFHGAQIGYRWTRNFGNLEIEARLSGALGVNHQILDISGYQNRTRPGQATQTFSGGLLATGPNLGRFTSNQFSVVPEGTFNIGYRFSPNFKIYAGYNFIYWSNVIRPGDQIDRTVDVALVPNPPAGVPASGLNRPLPTFRQADFWAQGIQFGAEVKW